MKYPKNNLTFLLIVAATLGFFVFCFVLAQVRPAVTELTPMDVQTIMGAWRP